MLYHPLRIYRTTPMVGRTLDRISVHLFLLPRLPLSQLRNGPASYRSVIRQLRSINPDEKNKFSPPHRKKKGQSGSSRRAWTEHTRHVCMVGLFASSSSQWFSPVHFYTTSCPTNLFRYLFRSAATGSEHHPIHCDDTSILSSDVNETTLFFAYDLSVLSFNLCVCV